MSLDETRTSFRREGRLYWQYAGCQHQCSVTSGTVFEATKLPLTRWFLAMQLLTQAKNNISALELKRQLGVSYRTAGMSYQVADDTEPHRSYTDVGARLFIVD